MNDQTLKWLIERSHNAYLSYAGLWLASLLGIVNVLMSIASNSNVIIDHTIFTISMYALLVLGMIFALYRIANTIKEHINWVIQIENEQLRNEILSHRGKLSEFIVDSEGKLCIRNRNFGIALHIVFAGLFLFLVVLPN